VSVFIFLSCQIKAPSDFRRNLFIPLSKLTLINVVTKNANMTFLQAQQYVKKTMEINMLQLAKNLNIT